MLSKVLGAQVLKDLQTFVAALDTTFGGFRERADATYALLQAPGTAFLVVAAPEPDALREASYFVERLAEDGMPLAGLVLNRVHRLAAGELSASAAWAPRSSWLEQRRGPAHRWAAAAARRADAAGTGGSGGCARGFTSAFPQVAVAEVAAQAADVHDLAGLRDDRGRT